ncbi:hypothetical protein BCV39_21250 [Vibrio sp. 10N.286.55.E10]|nr:hypothetical protein BCV39_21250 [Vibrio sp. 10N.286.55.E10]PME37358.1 hypothetical protein BCV40_06635 [Vibrio sp. 10N.286.55.E12]PME67978.1 hypothetical protein BCV32_13930 [Vibrio sp. 10N.286.55.C11]
MRDDRGREIGRWDNGNGRRNQDRSNVSRTSSRTKEKEEFISDSVTEIASFPGKTDPTLSAEMERLEGVLGDLQTRANLLMSMRVN